jgi:hypothetical protein
MDNSIEASKYYYWERCLKIKNFRSEYRELPPRALYAGPYYRIWKDWFKRLYDFKRAVLYTKWRAQYHLECLFKKEYRNSRITLTLYYIGSIIEKLLWGFGEKPLRIIRNCILLIIGYAAFYSLTDNTNLKGNLINSIYYSVITFTTLGYGDITPSTSLEKMVASSEALFGAVSMGLIIAAYTKKART